MQTWRHGCESRRYFWSAEQLSLIKFMSFICRAQTQEFLAQLLMTFMLWSTPPNMVQERECKTFQIGIWPPLSRSSLSKLLKINWKRRLLSLCVWWSLLRTAELKAVVKLRMFDWKLCFVPGLALSKHSFQRQKMFLYFYFCPWLNIVKTLFQTERILLLSRPCLDLHTACGVNKILKAHFDGDVVDGNSGDNYGSPYGPPLS